VDPNGARQTGELTADTRDEVLGQLRRTGLRPVTVDVHTTSALNRDIDVVAVALRGAIAVFVGLATMVLTGAALPSLPLRPVIACGVGLLTAVLVPKRRLDDVRSSIGKIKPAELAVFTRQLATLVSSGLPLLRCLDTLVAQTENPRLVTVIRTVRGEVAAGTPLSDALGQHPRWFDAFYQASVRAGETSGDLDSVLTRLARAVERQAELRRKVKSAMRYPITIGGLSLLIVSVMLVTLVPRFEDIFQQLEGELPVLTRVMITLSDLLRANLFAVLVVVAVGSVLWRRWRRTDAGERIVDRALLRVPVFGVLLTKVALARFASSLALLTRSGISILEALEIARHTVRNRHIDDALGLARDDVRVGVAVADALEAHDVFPPLVVQMVSVGERTGRLDSLMDKVAEFYEAETDATVAGLTSLIQPILMVVMGSVVGVMVIALYLPMFQVINQIK
jgi:type IV pilus assembly protein PilC